MQYTGKSINCMHVRHGGHRQEIENSSSELGRHFARCGYDSLSLQIIDCVREGEDLALIHLEGVWQNRLATFQVHGNINIRDEMRVNSQSLFFWRKKSGPIIRLYGKWYFETLIFFCKFIFSSVVISLRMVADGPWNMLYLFPQSSNSHLYWKCWLPEPVRFIYSMVFRAETCIHYLLFW